MPGETEVHTDKGVPDTNYLTFFTAWAGALGALALGALFIAREWNDPRLGTLEIEHFRALIGLPVAMLGGVVVVSLFRTTEGKIKISGLGFTFEGASGPIVMWALCFLVEVLGLSVLW